MSQQHWRNEGPFAPAKGNNRFSPGAFLQSQWNPLVPYRGHHSALIPIGVDTFEGDSVVLDLHSKDVKIFVNDRGLVGRLTRLVTPSATDDPLLDDRAALGARARRQLLVEEGETVPRGFLLGNATVPRVVDREAVWRPPYMPAALVLKNGRQLGHLDFAGDDCAYVYTGGRRAMRLRQARPSEGFEAAVKHAGEHPLREAQQALALEPYGLPSHESPHPDAKPAGWRLPTIDLDELVSSIRAIDPTDQPVERLLTGMTPSTDISDGLTPA